MAKVDTSQRIPIGHTMPGICTYGRGTLAAVPKWNDTVKNMNPAWIATDTNGGKQGYRLSRHSAPPQIHTVTNPLHINTFNAYGYKMPDMAEFSGLPIVIRASEAGPRFIAQLLWSPNSTMEPYDTGRIEIDYYSNDNQAMELLVSFISMNGAFTNEFIGGSSETVSETVSQGELNNVNSGLFTPAGGTIEGDIPVPEFVENPRRVITGIRYIWERLPH